MDPREIVTELFRSHTKATIAQRDVIEATGMFLDNQANEHCAETLQAIHDANARIRDIVSAANTSYSESLKDINSALQTVHAPLIDDAHPRRIARQVDVTAIHAMIDASVAETRKLTDETRREFTALSKLCTVIGKQVSAIESRPAVQPAIDDEALVEAVVATLRPRLEEVIASNRSEAGRIWTQDDILQTRVIRIEDALSALDKKLDSVRRDIAVGRETPPHLSPQPSPKPDVVLSPSLKSEELFSPKPGKTAASTPPEGDPSGDDPDGDGDPPATAAAPNPARRSASVLGGPSGTSGSPYLPKVKDLPTFSANPKDDIDEWISRITTVYQQMGVDENKVVVLLPMLLKDHAFTWLSRLPRDYRQQLTTWEEWQEELRDAFRAANFESVKLHELRMRTWKSGESFAAYFSARTRLQRNVFGDNAKDAVLIHDIVSGLPTIMHSTIKGHLALSPKKTMTELRRVMLDLEPSLTQFYYSSEGAQPRQQQLRPISSWAPRRGRGGGFVSNGFRQNAVQSEASDRNFDRARTDRRETPNPQTSTQPRPAWRPPTSTPERAAQPSNDNRRVAFAPRPSYDRPRENTAPNPPRQSRSYAVEAQEYDADESAQDPSYLESPDDDYEHSEDAYDSEDGEYFAEASTLR